MLVGVLIPIAKNNTYTYKTSLDLQIGEVVVVPFKNKNINGIVWEIDCKSDLELGKIKSVIEKTNIILKKELLDLIKWSSSYYFIPLGMVAKMTIDALKYNNTKNESFKQEINNFNLKELSKEQNAIKEHIEKHNEFNVFLLEGMTGSGKTEVYFHLIADVLV